MYFQNYGLRKLWLDKCLKNPVCEEPLKRDMVEKRTETLLKSEPRIL